MNLPEGVYEKEILPKRPLPHGVREAFADRIPHGANHHGIDPKQIGTINYSVCETRIAS